MVFPGLQIARRPVIEQAQAKNVLVCLSDRDTATGFVAFANQNAHFQFEVQALAGTKIGLLLPFGWAGLADGAWELLAGHTDAGGTAVVANGYPLVVGQQGRIRAELFAYRRCVVHGNIEVGVVPNLGGQGVFQLAALDQHGAQARLS